MTFFYRTEKESFLINHHFHLFLIHYNYCKVGEKKNNSDYLRTVIIKEKYYNGFYIKKKNIDIFYIIHITIYSKVIGIETDKKWCYFTGKPFN